MTVAKTDENLGIHFTKYLLLTVHRQNDLTMENKYYNSAVSLGAQRGRLLPTKIIKGTVSQDFLLLVFFMNQYPSSP